MDSQLSIYAIYTLEDIAVMHQIVQQLKSSVRNVDLTIWKDDAIKPGEVWKPLIESRFHEAEIFIVFISNSFMHSQFVKQLEFKLLIDRYKAGSAKVIPILLDNCPWDVDFEADEYTFSFKELSVLPEAGRPLKTWDSQEEAYEKIVADLESELPLPPAEATPDTAKTEEQMALSFNEGKEKNEEQRRVEEAKAIAGAEEEKRVQQEAEAKERAKEEKSKIETEAKRVAQEKSAQAEKSRRKQEATRLQKEVEAKRMADEESRRQAKRETIRIAEEASSKETQKPIEPQEKSSGISRKKMLMFAAGAALLTLTIWAFSLFNTSSEKPADDSEMTSEEIIDSVSTKISGTEKDMETSAISTLAIGDFYEEGMVFAVDANSKNGMIVHLEDAGPMTWEKAMQIHEQLGQGWRLPTFDELLILRKTVGQGATNTAEFSNGLYWSATDFDQYQARLLRFRDGNSSYHFNKVAAHRKYKVRAIRDFSQ